MTESDPAASAAPGGEGHGNAVPPGFATFLNMRVVEWGPDRIDVALDLRPELLNSHGTPHGGVLMSLLDTACTLAGCYRPPPQRHLRAMTVSLTTNFLAQARGGTILARAHRTGGGARVYMSSAEVFDGEGRVIATGQGVFRYRVGEGGESAS